MSIDLTGNTNFAALKNLQDEVIVPRTSLAAVDMVTANGIERNGNVLKVKEAAAADMLSGSTTGAVVTADNLKKALAMGQATLLDMHTHELTIFRSWSPPPLASGAMQDIRTSKTC